MTLKFDYGDMQITAHELISEFGQQAKLVKKGLPDPDLGGKPTVDRYDIVAVPTSYDQRLVNGTTIRNTDREIYISSRGLTVKPEPNDVVELINGRYTIVSPDNNNYDGITDVVYIVQGRVAL